MHKLVSYLVWLVAIVSLICTLCVAYNPDLPVSESNRPYLYGMPQPRHTLPGRVGRSNRTKNVPRRPPNAEYTFPSRLSEAALARMHPRLRRAYHESRLTKMMDWGLANGVHLSPLIHFNVTEWGTSIHARHAVPRDEEIIRVPLDLILSERTAQEKGPFGWFQQWKEPQEQIVMYILHELSNATSRYRPWFDAWPAVEDGYHHYSPITWTRQELEDQLPDFVQAISPHQEKIVEAYERLRTSLVLRLPEVIQEIKLPQESGDFDPWRFQDFFTFERFKYAWMMDSTRRHSCPREIHAPACIIPFMDMFSHEPGMGGVGHPRVPPEDPHHAVMRSSRRYKKGEELKCSYSYGASNSYLLSYYGFVVPDQPYDNVYVDISRYASPQFNLLAGLGLGNYTKAYITRRNPPLLALHAMRLNVSAALGAPLPLGGRASAGPDSMFVYGDAHSVSPTSRELAHKTGWTNYEALRRLRALQPVSVDIELKAITALLSALNPLITPNKQELTTVYPYFAYQSVIATERAFRQTLDQALNDRESPHRDPREKFRYASMLREEQCKLHLSAVTYLMKRRKYILQHCVLPPFDWKEDRVQDIIVK